MFAVRKRRRMHRVFSTERLYSTLGFLLHILFVAAPKDIWRWTHLKRKNVAGKTIVITGGASGIGKCLAEIFSLRHHSNVAILDINICDAHKTANGIKARGGVAHAWKCDIRSSEELELCAAAIAAKFGPVDIVICNAAVLYLGKVLELSDFQLEDSLRTNILGTANTIRVFLRPMELRNKGHIVAISSIAGFYGEAYGMAYCASKFAIRGMMESIENEMRDRKLFGIQFTTVCPYFTRTPMILNKNMRPVSTWFPFMSVQRCSEQVVDAVLKEKILAFVPNCVAILAVLKCFLSKYIRVAGRKYINCRYEPNSDFNTPVNVFANAEDFFQKMSLFTGFLNSAMLLMIAVIVCGGSCLMSILVVWSLLTLTTSLTLGVYALYICDTLGFSHSCSFRWFVQAALIGLPCIYSLNRYKRRWLRKSAS